MQKNRSMIVLLTARVAEDPIRCAANGYFWCESAWCKVNMSNEQLEMNGQ